jgi:hypothetical protein
MKILKWVLLSIHCFSKNGIDGDRVMNICQYNMLYVRNMNIYPIDFVSILH